MRAHELARACQPRPGSFVLAVLIVVTTSIALGPPDARGDDEPPALETLLHRAGAYVGRYATTFKNVVAEEHYRQWWQDPRSSGLTARTLRSDMVFAVVPGPLPWTTFRDVYEVDGNEVRNREARLERLFVESPRSAVEQAHAILRESSRYNLGTEFRTINVPTLCLLFLQPENQQRLSFERKGRRSFDGLETHEVKFEEELSPTLVRDSWGNDVPARGRAWIEPSRGIVLRTEVEYDLRPEASEREQLAFVATRYRREPGLDVFVPSEMKEWYTLPTGRIEGTARYANYRRFQVTTEEKSARTAPPEIGVAPPPSAGMTVDLETPGSATSGGLVIGIAPPKAAEPEPALRPVPPLPGDIGGLLQRAGEYVLGYEESFRTVAAREECREWFEPGDGRSDVRTLRSDVVFAMVAGPSPWVLYRDVFEISGHHLRERDERLARLFRESPGSAPREASALSRESERHLRPPERRMWVPLPVPTAVLSYLHPDHRDRFTFERAGRSTREDREVVELRFAEKTRPTMMVDGGGGDLPAEGKLFVREDDGAVLEAEVEYRFSSRQRETMRVTTEFAPEGDLGMLVPVEVRQLVEQGSAAGQATPRGPRLDSLGLESTTLGARVETRLRYSEFERLSGER